VGSGNLENLPSESGSGEPQLGPKVLDLNAEGVLKILGAQKLLAEVSVGGNLPLNVFHEGAYLLLIGARNVSHMLHLRHRFWGEIVLGRSCISKSSDITGGSRAHCIGQIRSAEMEK